MVDKSRPWNQAPYYREYPDRGSDPSRKVGRDVFKGLGLIGAGAAGLAVGGMVGGHSGWDMGRNALDAAGMAASLGAIGLGAHKIMKHVPRGE